MYVCMYVFMYQKICMYLQYDLKMYVCTMYLQYDLKIYV